MTPQDIIDEVRYHIQDTDPHSTGYRQEDAELLIYVNNALREVAIFKPQLFTKIGDVACTVGQCEQGIAFSDAVEFIEVISIHNGAALTPFSIPVMDAFNPSWRTDTAATPTQWAKYPGDPLKFFVYPKVPVAGATVDVRYIARPTEYALDDDITDVPITLKSALVDYVVYRASMKDDEFIADGRASAFFQSFVAKVKG